MNFSNTTIVVTTKDGRSLTFPAAEALTGGITGYLGQQGLTVTNLDGIFLEGPPPPPPPKPRVPRPRKVCTLLIEAMNGYWRHARIDVTKTGDALSVSCVPAVYPWLSTVTDALEAAEAGVTPGATDHQACVITYNPQATYGTSIIRVYKRPDGTYFLRSTINPGLRIELVQYLRLALEANDEKTA